MIANVPSWFAHKKIEGGFRVVGLGVLDQATSNSHDDHHDASRV